MTKAERALALHAAGSACSQVVFAAFAKDLDVVEYLEGIFPPEM
jgi:hypothetical protein